MNKKSFWKPRKIVGALVGPLVLLAVLPAPANAYPRPGITERVSVASDGAQSNRGTDTYGPSISADGRYIAFINSGSNLVQGDTNGALDVFVHDVVSGDTERVSVASDGTQSNGNSYLYAGASSISADGRYVVFFGPASNLVHGDTNGAWDGFVHDRATGATERVSVASDGAQGNENSMHPSISADGRYVAFFGESSNLVPGDTNGMGDTFVYDRATGVTERVSVASDGSQGNLHSYEASISADGRHVAFWSLASNMVQGDTNGVWDVFVHDRETGATERVSVASGGAEGTGDSQLPSISGDGRYVAFVSYASNLVPGDTNGAYDTFVYDRATGVTERVSVASDGAQGNLPSVGGTTSSFGFDLPHTYPPKTSSISADGRYVAFHTPVSNLVPGDTNAVFDIFVHDRATRATERVSVASDGTEGESFSGNASISADGRHVAFWSLASNLVQGDSNGASDVFVHNRGPGIGIIGGLSLLEVGSEVVASGGATFSGEPITKANESDEDGGLRARALGGELTGASLTYRPEGEDLLLRLRVASLPPATGGTPGILYGLEFTAGETLFKLRALRAAGTSASPAAPYVALYRCAPACVEETVLTGAFGSAGVEVTASIPLAVLEASEGTALSDLRAFTATGEAAVGVVEPLDEMVLPDAVVPASRVEFGIAPPSVPEEEVAFTAVADLSDGAFSGSVSTASLSPGSYRVWARACLGDACGPAAFGEVAL